MSENTTAIVTGGSRGIGRAVAIKLASLGTDIAVVATHDGSAAKDTIKAINDLGRKAKLYVCNISDFEAVSDTVSEIIKDFGGVDILVNNAGITKDKLLMQMSEEDISDVIDVNLKGSMYVTKACLRTFMRQRHGRIVNISSVVGLMGNAGQTNYTASKAGIIGFTKSVAREYASKGITCNAVAPGFIRTDMTDKMPEDAVKAMLSNIPAGRYGEPSDVAETVAFLVSDAAAYITGEVIKVDGGMYI